MALNGLHVTCAPIANFQSVALMKRPAWSHTMANPGSTTLKAPSVPMIAFEVRSSVDAFVAIGPNPDASPDGEGRIFVAANVSRQIFCDAGDKLAWIAA